MKGDYSQRRAPTTALNAPRTAQKFRVDKLYLKTKNEYEEVKMKEKEKLVIWRRGNEQV